MCAEDSADVDALGLGICIVLATVIGLGLFMVKVRNELRMTHEYARQSTALEMIAAEASRIDAKLTPPQPARCPVVPGASPLLDGILPIDTLEGVSR